MSNNLKGAVVVLEQPIDNEYGQIIISAIKQIRGVAEVTALEDNPNDIANRMMVRNEIGQKLMDVLYKKQEQKSI